MKKLTILFDLDGICADLLNPWIDYINKRYHRNLTIEDINIFDMGDLPKTKDIAGKVYKIIQRPMFFYDLKPLPGAVNAIEALVREGHHVIFLSKPAGPDSAWEKMLWVNKYFPTVGDQNVILTKHKSLVQGDVFMDDKGATVEEYKKKWPDALVMTIKYPYNSYLENNTQGVVVVGDYTNTDVAWGNALNEIRKAASSVVSVSTGLPNCS